ncbi:hypothetical protein R3X25_05325 [Lutibacter sp. TH_r2]|uniref:hypothetical protein n=1 Tax=Lutibacter sp. TH_r2 TaxID=3082083 RepID=UPI0029541F54|nr:hypothetical protein [Lutibacter sp. TH_r2]MDV7186695.1 hypothetical protein [Lutibacter sp. TH_r2]
MKIIKVITSLLIFISIISCKSAESILTNKTPFKIEKATFSTWHGGVRGVSGYKLELKLNKPYKLDSIYFRNQKGALELDKTKNVYTAVFTIRNKTRNPFGNKKPNNQKNIPFELKKDEAVISFQTNKGIQYYKITNVEEVEGKRFP